MKNCVLNQQGTRRPLTDMLANKGAENRFKTIEPDFLEPVGFVLIVSTPSLVRDQAGILSHIGQAAA
jgi:hypothetical protein